jgi:hypothetical protein
LRVDRLTRDLELQIELQKSEVVACHIANESEYDDLACVFRGQEFGAGRFRCAAQLSEEIELECRVGSERQKVILGLFDILLAAVEVGVTRNLREKAGAGNRKLRTRSIDAFSRELQIVVLFERRANEFLQFRILKYLPPGEIGIRGILRLKLRIL